MYLQQHLEQVLANSGGLEKAWQGFRRPIDVTSSFLMGLSDVFQMLYH
jgi:hypothetical protein